MNTSVRSLRCLAVWLMATAVAAAVVATVRSDAVALAGGPGADLEAALLRVGSAVLVGCAGWAWLATTVVVLDAARGRTGAVRGVPRAWRRAVLLACGTALAAGVAAAPATADPGLGGLPLPDRADGAASAHVVAGAADVRVRPGDSLWALAADRLGPDASATEVDHAWRRLYRLNRSVVGPDPDLIHPGQQLRLPSPPQEPS